MKSFLFKSCLTFLIFILVSLRIAYSEESAQTTDPYAPVAVYQSEESLFKKVTNNFLAYPFEIIRWPVDQSLTYTERYHLERKGLYLFERMVDKGFTPYVDPSQLGGGFNLDYIRLFNQRSEFAVPIAKSWFELHPDVNFKVGTQLGAERIANTGFRGTGNFQYESRPQEHFYGIGPNTSAGDGTSYKIESTVLGTRVGYSVNPQLACDFNFSYQNINITNGKAKGRGGIDSTFPAGSIPGLDGDELLNWDLEFLRDTRNRVDNSTKGELGKISMGYYEGLYHSNARYFKTKVELQHFFRLGSDRRVLMLRLYGENNNELPGHGVPFHQMARLGGFGGRVHSTSETLRGYDYNRFFDRNSALGNLEYRFTVWEHGDFKLATVFFFDEGSVFKKLSKFRLSDFRESYGVGQRFSLADTVYFSVEVAHGNEGTKFYVESTTPF